MTESIDHELPPKSTETTETSEFEKLNKKPSSAKSLIKNSDFVSLFVAGAISEIGNYFTYIAIYFLALDLTDGLGIKVAAQQIAYITFFLIIPSATLGPFTGALADRLDRKKIMYMFDLLGALLTIGLIYVTTVSRSMYHIYAISFLAAVVRLFFYPARGASIPKIVNDPTELVSANGFIQIFSQLSRIIGPALAGITIDLVGLEIAFIIDGISFFISAILIFTINTDLKPINNDGITMKKIGGDLIFGFQMIINDRILTFVLFVFTIAIFLIGMIDPLFVTYLSYEFGLHERDFGYILSLSAISGLISALILTARGDIQKKLTFSIFAVLIAGTSISLLGYAPQSSIPIFYLYAGMMIVGIVNVLFTIPLSSLLQTIVPNEHLGKINGLLGTSISLAQAGGAFLASQLATKYAISLIFLGIGASCLIVGFLALAFIKILNLESLSAKKEKEMIVKTNKSPGVVVT